MPTIISGDDPEREGERKGNPVRGARSDEADYRRSLIALNRELKLATLSIGTLVRSGAGARQIADEVQRRLDEANRRYDAAADRLAQRFIGRTSNKNKQKIERMLSLSMGVDMSFIDTTAIREKIDQALAENVNLIKSIPEQHFSKVSQAIFQSFRGEKFAEGGLTNRLKKIGRLTDDRAKLIARDQSGKFVSSLNEIRQKDAGIEGYIWRTSKDNRVVGNPSGLYPKGNRAHMDHWNREGKFFTWDNPPPDGHPGQAINCRCFAEPVVNRDKVRENAL